MRTVKKQLPRRIRQSPPRTRSPQESFTLTSRRAGWGRGWTLRSHRHGNFYLSSWTRKLREKHFPFWVTLQRYWFCPAQKKNRKTVLFSSGALNILHSENMLFPEYWWWMCCLWVGGWKTPCTPFSNDIKGIFLEENLNHSRDILN